MKDLGLLTDLPLQSHSKPNAINWQGKVIEANLFGGSYRALLYGGAWTNLGTLGGANSFGVGINDSNMVVGFSLTADGSDHAFLWTPGGTDGVAGNVQMKDLGTLGGSTSEAYGINRSGLVTGFAATTRNDHAFVYSNSVMRDIGTLMGNGLPNSYGFGINDLGHVAGTAYNSSYSVAHAFFYNGTTVTDLGTLGGSGASALAINDADRIVGYATTADGFDHAFRFANGVMTDLGTLGGNYSYGIGLNNSNVVVGGSFIDATNSVYHAFICPSNTMFDLNNLLGTTGTGWVLEEARAINDAGQIVGTGIYNGAKHGFLLSPVPRITGIKVVGNSLVITFTTLGGAQYSVESAAGVSGASWTNLQSGIKGTGGLVNATNGGLSSLGSRFYRVVQSIP